MRSSFLAALVLSLAAPVAATTTNIDFSGLPDGTQASPIVFPQATFVSSTGTFFAGASGIAKEICPLTSAFNCSAAMTVNFTGPVNNLRFSSVGDDAASSVFVAITTMTGSFNFIGSSDGNFAAFDLHDLSAYSGVTSIVITNNDGAGLAYDRFSFDTAVPEPQSWALLIAGFGLVGTTMRRRKAALPA